ncbi:hypothetical protein [Marinobacterium lutimaris]|uniref:Uncharacterized protein n=1 Tax=Marinobacterium lutimaris TaxID=568106 RepID=A0A1H5XKS0_9GAMM|nr:hypothetical protein [Marinobacterium lutimaris]SEG12341.1 hypothetical protein SAMN05444390_1011421 [Marinobacterium lutimaris]
MARYQSSGAHLFDSAAFEQIKSKLKKREDEIEAALADAVNFAAEDTVTLTAEEWNAYFRIKSDYIGNKVRVMRRASPGRLEAVVGARSRATRADNFDYKVMPGRKGVRLRVRRGRSGGVLRNAFVIPRAKSNGKPLIIERLVKYKKGEARNFKHGGKERAEQFGRVRTAEQLRFKALYGPSVNQHFYDSRARVAPRAMSEAKQRFMKAIGA